MSLICKTQSNSLPQGKPRVYLAIDPEHRPLLDTLAAEILGCVNAAVFYLSDEPFSLDEHFEQLKEMNLFVFAVTERFFDEGSFPLFQELPFAKENRLTVLPLMLETGLDASFNEAFGSLEYLDRTSIDKTVRPYREKLSGYLSSVLVSDALAARVREAFDSYIFLSYRKKDRRAAKELMEKIHENEKCRDVAIWYDEFLTPGENFNDAIADALKKSDVFALAVTPNLINETNYVMTTEYPMAKKEGKPILAAELVPTDKDALNTLYDGIPNTVDVKEEALFDSLLLDILENVPLRQNDTDPEHCFLIGIAYLAGIDVEKNTDRALELITRAANSGYPEAMEKLVRLYRYGESVEQSYPQAITYQNDLLLRAERLWKIEKSEEHARLLIKQLRIYGDLYFQSDDNENAGGAYRMLLRYVRSMKESFSFPFLAEAESAAYTNLGELAYHKKDISTAIAYATEALAVTKAAYDKTPTDILAYSLALIYFDLGTYHESIVSEDPPPEWFEDEMPKETIAYFENIVCLFKSAAELFEVLSRKKGFEDTALDLFAAYYHAEQMLSILERNDEARAYILKAREILVMLRDELDEDDAERANFDEWIDKCDLELDLLDLSDLV